MDQIELTTQRLSEIKSIENDISDLSEISQALKNMVVEQGTELSDIESNISSATENTTQGVAHLESAEKHRNWRNRVVAGITVAASLATAGMMLMIVARKPK